jgi:lipid A 3-O-deacylase
VTVDFILYKWEEDFFHQYMMTLGMVGPSSAAENFQKAISQYNRK